MGVSTVERSTRGTKSRKANDDSRFSFRSLFARPDDEPEPFAPDEQSRWLFEHIKGDLRGELSKAVDYLVARQAKASTAASPTDLDGSRPAYLLRRLALQALDLEVDPSLTFGDAVKRLQWAWDMLLERAAEESAFERHTPVNAAEAMADGALLANRPSVQRARVVVATVVDRSRNAQVPTALQVPMSEDVLARIDNGESPESVEASASPTAAGLPSPSPVHVEDGTAPPIPDADDEDAEESDRLMVAAAPLPKRPEQVNVLGYSERDPYTAIDPADESIDLGHGAWLFDEGGSITGPVWWRLARRHVEVHEKRVVARLDFANGVHVEVPAGRQVRVLDPQRAKELLAQHEAALAAKRGDAA